jgi:DNA-binding MarR family transcriptional regulator
MNTLDYLTAISRNEKMFNKLYQAASSRYNLPEGSLWILYFLIFSDEDVTQLDIAERMFLPKQTINSATANLAEKGFVKLEKIDGSKRKKILLTEEGERFTEETVRHILDAECRAVERMGDDKISQYIKLYDEFYECMRSEFTEEGIIDA